MSTEKTYTIVGTAVNSDGTIKMRWANDLISRIKILVKHGCSDIDLITLPNGMTKLAAAEFYRSTGNLTPAQEEVVTLKINEKSHLAKRRDVKATLVKNVKSRISGKKTDPKVEKFIQQESEIPTTED